MRILNEFVADKSEFELRSDKQISTVASQTNDCGMLINGRPNQTTNGSVLRL